MTDAEFAKRDEAIVKANLENWREAGMSEAEMETEFAVLTPPVLAAY
jgi:hypothetical protein